MRAFARPAPATMNKEWQEATNERLKVCLTLFRSVLLGNKEPGMCRGWMPWKWLEDSWTENWRRTGLGHIETLDIASVGVEWAQADRYTTGRKL